MNVEDIVRGGLRDAAEQVVPIADLHVTAVQRGRRRRIVRRGAALVGTVAAVSAIVGGSLFLAGGNGAHPIAPAGGQKVIADPWWQTWTPNRHDGPLDPAFLAAAHPTYDKSSGPEPITVYAGGTTSDGTEWVMFTDPTEGHRVEWLMGRDSRPLVGDVPGEVTPEMTWTSWSFPTQSTEDGTSGNQQWLIIVGRPGTTQIDFSADGTSWQPLDTHDGIAVTFLSQGFPPATAKVRLSDASGVYATGTPEGAGAGRNTSPEPTASPTPGSEPTPSPTPTDGSTPS